MCRAYLDVAYENGSGGVRLHGHNQYWDNQGELRRADFNDPTFVGRELASVQGLEWTAYREAPRSEAIADIASFETSLFLSPRAKALFDEYGITTIQYIPIKLFEHASSDASEYEGWWYGHVCNWRAPLDLSKSEYKRGSWPSGNLRMMAVAIAMGGGPISNLKNVSLNESETLDPVFLAKVPNHAVWSKVYLSKDFADFLRNRLGAHLLRRLYMDEDPFAPHGFLTLD